MKKLLISLFIFLIFFSCEKDKGIIANYQDASLKEALIDTSSEIVLSKQRYDKAVKKLAKSLSHSLADPKIRKFVKSNAMEMNDGDFDIIWKDVKEKEVDLIGKKFKEIIAADFEEDGLKKDLNTKLLEIEKFGNEFPQLQISIPVQCKKWDENNNIPLVAFKSSSYIDGGNKLEAYNSKGNIVALDRKIVPKETVIVIGFSERTDKNGDIYPEYKKKSSSLLLKSANLLNYVSPEVPFNLTGIFERTGVYLTWEYVDNDDPASGYTDYFIVERLEIESGLWIEIANAPAIEMGGVFLDTQATVPGTDYYYRVKTRRQFEGGSLDSFYSQSVMVQGINLAPLPISTLTTLAGFPEEVELRWSINIIDPNASGYKIYRRAMGLEDYQLVATVGASIFNYIDRATKIKGQEYSYYVVSYNAAGNSQPIYDIVYAPYRSKTDKLVITTFTLNNHQNWEDWADGYPEFELSSAWKPNSSSTETVIQKYRERLSVSPLDSSFDNRMNVTNWKIGNTDHFYALLLGGDWTGDFASSVLSLNFLEYDGAGWLTDKDFSFSTKIAYKSGPVTGELNFSLANSKDHTLSANNNCKKFGDSYIRFWDPDVYDLYFGTDLKVKFETRP